MQDTSNYLKFIRPLLLAAAVIIPLLGYIDIVRGSNYHDPILYRIIISLYCFGVVISSYFNNWVKKNIMALQNGVVFIGLVWFEYLTFLNNFHTRYIYGLLILVFICSFTFSKIRTLIIYLISTTILTYLSVSYSDVSPDEAVLIIPRMALLLVTLYFVNAYVIRKRLALEKAEIDLEETKDKIERLAAIAEETDNLILLADEDNKIEWVNKAFESSTGFNLEDVSGKNPNEFLLHEETSKQTIDLISETLKNKSSIVFENKNNRKDGSSFWVETRIQSIFNDKGEFLYFLGIQNDISKKKESEEKLQKVLTDFEWSNWELTSANSLKEEEIKNREEAESKLKASEQKLKAILEALPDLIFIQDLNGTYIDYYTPSDDDLFVDPSAFMNKNMKDIFPPQLYQGFKDKIDETIKTGELVNHRYQIEFDDGIKYFEARILNFSEEHVLTVIKNITTDKLLEKEKEEQLHLQAVFTELLSIDKIDFSLEDLLNQSINVLKKIDFLQQCEIKIFSTDIDENTQLIVSTKKQNHTFQEMQKSDDYLIYPLELLSNKIGYICFNNAHLLDSDKTKRTLDQLSNILALMMKNKLDNLEIINQKSFIDNITDNTPDMIMVIDILKNEMIYTNERVVKLTGLDQKELNKLDNHFKDIVLQEDLEIFNNAINDCTELRGSEIKEISFRVKSKNDNIIWLNSNIVSFKENSSGDVIQILLVAQDITKQQENHMKLKTAEERWEFALEGAGDGVWDWNMVDNSVYFSPQWKKMLGFEDHEIQGSLEEWEKRVHPDDLDQVYIDLNKHFNQETDIYINEHRCLCKDGSYKWILDRGKVIARDSEGKGMRMIGTHTDIDENKRTSQIIKDSNERFANLVENISGVYWIKDVTHNKMMYVSPNFEFIWQKSLDDLYANPDLFIESVHPDDLQMVIQEYEAVSDGKPFSLEYRIVTPDNSVKWIWARSKLFAQKGILMDYGYAEDITERKLYEEAILAKQEELDIATRTAKLGGWTVPLDGSSGPIWSDEVKRIHEVPMDYQPDLETAINFYHPDYRDQIREAVNNSIENNTPWNLECKLITYKGNHVWVRAIGAAVLNDEGKPVKISGTFQDITEIKIAEDERNRLFNLSVDLICISSFEGFFIQLNKSFPDTLGWTDSELKASPFIEFVHPDDIDNTLDAMADLGNNNEITSFTNRYRCKDGSYKWLSWNATPLIDDNRIYAIARDITSDIEFQDELKNAKERAEDANKSKSAFLANMSHEIRTPMNSILGFGEILKEQLEQESHPSSEHASSILKSGNSLLTLINDILDLSKIEAGKLDIVYDHMQIEQIVNEVHQILSVKSQKKGIEFNLKFDQNIPANINFDETRFRQILINLIGNAIKFTEEGSVSLELNLISKTDEDFAMEILIKDSGIGIPEDKVDTIFESFRQSDERITRKFGGTGLGLSITKKLTEMLGGDISVESKFGEGSVFKVVFNKIEISSNDQVVSDSSEEILNRKFEKGIIYLIDDKIENVKLMNVILKSIGEFEIYEAFNGIEAVNLFDNSPKPDLVLMDVQMPEMDGIEATKKIRENSEYDKIPIIGLSAFAMKDQIEEYSKQFNDYLTKPVNKLQLVKALSQFLEFKAEKIEESDTVSSNGKGFDLNQVNTELLSLIKDKYKEKTSNLLETLEIDSIAELGRELLAESDNFDDSDMKKFSEELISKTDFFDIDSISDQLQSLLNRLN